MAITYTWSITSLKTAPSLEGLSDVVTGIRFNYTGTDENGKTTTVACPGLFGTWPLIDYCRKYAFLIFTPGDASNENKELMASFKEIIDNQIISNCQ